MANNIKIKAKQTNNKKETYKMYKFVIEKNCVYIGVHSI